MEKDSLQKIIPATILVVLVASASLLYGQCPNPGNPPPDQEVMFDVTWGDDSSSESESYNLSIPNAEPAQLPNSIPGELTTKPLALRRDKSYTLTMNHVSTTLEEKPDYDYTLKIDGQGGEKITVLDKGAGGKWLIYDEDQIGGVHNESDEFYASGKELRLFPIEVVELLPKLRDADNNEIAGSEVPTKLPESNSMVEENSNTNRIAHREMKVKIGSALKNKRIIWTMDAKFTPEGQSQPSFRGDWARAAATHRDRFETSTAYGGHAYREITQEQAETTVDADGFTAIRVNLPPIGFNKARIKIQIEGTTTPLELIDLDVQAVVVIDPGHGGTPATDFESASWNNSTSPSGVLEKTMALSYGQELKTSLETHIQAQRLNIRVLITRTSDVSISGRDRAYLARDNGADQLFIIHFNALDDPPRPHTARGSLEVRQIPNLLDSLPEDIEFIDAVLDRMVPAMQAFDAGCSRHGHFVKDTTVATDRYMGNEENYHPVRAGYCEVEFIDFGAQTPDDRTDDTVDILLNTGPNAGAVKTAIANAMRDGIIQDLRTQPRPTP